MGLQPGSFLKSRLKDLHLQQNQFVYALRTDLEETNVYIETLHIIWKFYLGTVSAYLTLSELHQQEQSFHCHYGNKGC